MVSCVRLRDLVIGDGVLARSPARPVGVALLGHGCRRGAAALSLRALARTRSFVCGATVSHSDRPDYSVSLRRHCSMKEGASRSEAGIPIANAGPVLGLCLGPCCPGSA